MNILIVIPYFGGLKDGNPDVVDLSVELRKRRHTVVVLTTSYSNEARYEEQNGVHIFRIKPMTYVSEIDYSISFPFMKIYDLIKKFDVEIVHGVMEVGTQTLSAAIASTLLKKPFILTIQGAGITYGSTHIDAIASVFDYSVARIVYSSAKRFIILSENLSERALKIGATREKIQVIPSGIDYKEEFNPRHFNSDKIKKELNLQGNIVIGFSGRLVRLKGLISLLHAQRILKKDIENLCLFIIGDGPERHIVESVSKELDLNTKVIGWVRRSQIPFFLSAVDIFVNPSLTEGLPISVMEAMAMQKPVVATDVGGASDLVKDGENGFLVPPSDVKSLAQAIKTLALDDDLRFNMGRASRDIIRNNFDWDDIVTRIESVYKRVCY